MPAYLKSKYPDMAIDSVEIDPDVIYAAREYLGLKPDFNILIGDGRHLLRKQAGEYDLIVNDAFKGLKEIPFHLVTEEFHELVDEKLSPEGIYAINIIGQPAESRLTRSLLKTLGREFNHISIQQNTSGCVNNIWILASRKPLAYGRKPLEREIDSFALTDNHSPVAFLLARDFMHQH